ncbi:putative leader peptide [Actinacidiphila sp. DG2A-62]
MPRVPTPFAPPAVLLYRRRHIDLQRVAAALCRG